MLCTGLDVNLREAWCSGGGKEASYHHPHGIILTSPLTARSIGARRAETFNSAFQQPASALFYTHDGGGIQPGPHIQLANPPRHFYIKYKSGEAACCWGSGEDLSGIRRIKPLKNRFQSCWTRRKVTFAAQTWQIWPFQRQSVWDKLSLLKLDWLVFVFCFID